MTKENELFKTLSDENKTLVQEAIEHKVNEARESLREEVETQIREEYARRYDHDKALLVQAMDRMLTDAIREELEEFQIDRNEMIRERDRLQKAIAEAKTHYRGKMKENIQVLNDFVLAKLGDEVTELAEDRKAITAKRIKLSKQVTEMQGEYDAKLKEHVSTLQQFVLKQLKEEIEELAQDRRLLQEQRVKIAKEAKVAKTAAEKQAAERLSVLEGFVLKQLTNEMREFNDDRKALVETRVKLVSEGKAKLEETRASFVKNASKIVENTIENALRTEMTQFRDDLKAARENDFGRRIFETFVSEFMASHLSEGTEVKKMMKEVEKRDAKLNEAMAQLKKQNAVLNEAKARINKAEDGAKRSKVLSECLKDLPRDKRVVMEELLETVQTNRVKEAFNKYLPSVLGESDTGIQKKGRKKLNENQKSTAKPKVKAVSGNRTNRLSEAAKEQIVNESEEFDAEIRDLRLMAGI